MLPDHLEIGKSSAHRFSRAVVNEITFGQFRLDLGNECLWQGTRSISLRPKAFAVLRILLENAGHLVNKQQVLDAVWPGTFVGDAVLKDNIRQLREALNDDAGSPRYIETAHRRGYRFIARLSERSQGRSKSALVRQPDLSAVLDNAGSVSWATPRLLGREPELAKFRDLME